MKISTLALAAAALFASGSAMAVTYTYTGTTTGGPTYNRPLAGFSGLSAVGTAVAYSALSFTVSAAGSYSFLSTVTYDNFTFLYSGSFNPASPITNGIASNDDFTATIGGTSGFTATLATGTTYVFVNTGFANTDVGPFSTTIIGPGNIVPVPEPETYALMALGLVGIALARRRAGRAQA